MALRGITEYSLGGPCSLDNGEENIPSWPKPMQHQWAMMGTIGAGTLSVGFSTPCGLPEVGVLQAPKGQSLEPPKMEGPGTWGYPDWVRGVQSPVTGWPKHCHPESRMPGLDPVEAPFVVSELCVSPWRFCCAMEL